MIDPHGQPDAAYNKSRRKEKAACSLRGILQGVVADQKLSEQELLFLDVWLRSQSELDDPDFVDLLDAIGDVVADGTVDQEELEDVSTLISDILEISSHDHEGQAAAINELLGLTQGLVVDGELSPSEFTALKTWLDRNTAACQAWPGDVIADRVNAILRDGRVTAGELEDLADTLKRLCGDEFAESGAANGGVCEIFCDSITEFDHTGKIMCFTGRFVSGPRRIIEETARREGAQTAKSITKKTDTLVIGTIASRDWRFTSHGRKIEKAVQLQSSGSNLVILSERQWNGFLKG